MSALDWVLAGVDVLEVVFILSLCVDSYQASERLHRVEQKLKLDELEGRR